MDETILGAQRAADDALRFITANSRDPLIAALSNGTLLKVCALLDAGANANMTVPAAEGMTALGVAALGGRVEACAVLLDAGADPRRRMGDEITARDVAVNAGRFTTAKFLEETERMANMGMRPGPGQSYLELAWITMRQAKQGETCRDCGARVPSESSFDHLTSHLRQVERSEAVG